MDENIKKEYEVSCLLKTPDQSAEVEKILTTEEAEVFHRGEIKEIKLAYPIKKQTTAYFCFYYFRALPESVEKINKNLFLLNSILRFLIIKSPVIKAKPSYRLQDTDQKTPFLEAPLPEVSLPKVLSNESLEKKIEEILK